MTDRESLIKVLGEALKAAEEPTAAGRVARATYYQDTRNPWDRIAAAVISHHEESQWRPIDTALKDGSEILAASYGDPESIVVHWHDGSENYHGLAGWYADYAHLTARPVTVEIWRPLPVPPERRPE